MDKGRNITRKVCITLCTAQHCVTVQGDPYGRGKDYVDIKFKVPSQAWVAGQPYSLTQLQIWSQHKLFRDHTGHPVEVCEKRILLDQKQAEPGTSEQKDNPRNHRGDLMKQIHKERIEA